MIKINATQSVIEREPLKAPFGFKGGYLSELWQAVVRLESDSGKQGLGLGTQSTLWSDAGVFTSNDETTGNEFMYRMTKRPI